MDNNFYTCLKINYYSLSNYVFENRGSIKKKGGRFFLKLSSVYTRVVLSVEKRRYTIHRVDT